MNYAVRKSEARSAQGFVAKRVDPWVQLVNRWPRTGKPTEETALPEAPLLAFDSAIPFNHIQGTRAGVGVGVLWKTEGGSPADLQKEIGCAVERIEFFPAAHLGVLTIPAGGRCDMRGRISFFERFDPDIERIETFLADTPGAVYHRAFPGTWRAQ
jgi:hypothetical protein